MIYLYIATSLAADCKSFPVTADPSSATTLTETFTVPTKSGDSTIDNFKVQLNDSISTYTIKATDNAKVTIESVSKKATIKISGPVWLSLPTASEDITLEVEYNLTSKATPYLEFNSTDKFTITESFVGRYDNETNYTFAVANMKPNGLKNFTLTTPKADTKFYVLNMCEMTYTATASSSRNSLVDSTNFSDIQISEISSSLNAYSPDATKTGDPGSKKWKPGVGEIIAIVFCVIMVLLLILLILYFACCDKRRKARQASTQQESKPVENKKEESSSADNRMADSDSGSGVNV